MRNNFGISTSSSKIISAYDNMHLPSITAALALIGLSAATPTDTSSSSSKDQGLAQAWISKGRQYIGTALTIRDDPIEQGIIQARNEFNSITPENAMKWESTEPSRNNFTFAGADAIIDFADKYKKEFCTLEEDGTYRKSVFYNTIGEAFIPIAFRLASKYAGSHTKLYYNDYNLEYNNNKTLGALRILKLVQSYGVQIDGVGLQAHLTSEATASSGGGVTPDTNTLTKVLKGVFVFARLSAVMKST
ncbi:hypothetical protein D6C83_09081 [Aureobasidium pullulans]|uniref:Beta-xylanase n=1 Tax=Aureobasidium pullulans TaxID=5580 RepID=A0A4S9YX05_AURPU|nr:hypothetical protein D6C83_09081 [Aureobasidium pullulans]